jgi:polysaccharide export outer membrane protein
MRVMRHDAGLRLWQRLLMIVASSLALAACAGRGGPVPYEPSNFGKPDVETVTVAEGPSRLGALDKVRVNVFQVAELSGEFQVDRAGMIDFPLIGAVEAQGKTADELKSVLAARLGDKYLRNPNVQVAITEQTTQSITVDGSVKDPGVFAIKGTTTLMKAVAMAKGASEDAKVHRVIIFRTINGERMAGAFDLGAIRRAQALDPPIYGNDIVIVDGSKAQKMFKDLMSTIPLLGVLRPF